MNKPHFRWPWRWWRKRTATKLVISFGKPALKSK